MSAEFADKLQMQNRLFAELSAMFAREVPLYDRSLAVNRDCNTVVCDLVERLHRGFAVDAAQLERASGERHGAIRLGRPDELRWIARFFAAFAMEPHNFYNMTDLGPKSQPVLATAFRSRERPEHRVFTSLLMTDYFDASTQARVEALLAGRTVFSDRARELIEKSERQGGLTAADGDALIREGADRIFKWTGQARDFGLYQELCAAGFKIAADIACFESHHLNHLTPNTLCMDLYTVSMKFCLGELDESALRRRAAVVLERLSRAADRDWLRLHFKHLAWAQVEEFRDGTVTPADLQRLVDDLVVAMKRRQPDVARHRHSGFNEFTEGPPQDTPVLLRQDSYKALTEPVRFRQADGGAVDAVHTARFGEVEERFYATTPSGRDLYDRCLAQADAARGRDRAAARRAFDEIEARGMEAFAPIPKTLDKLLEWGLVYGLYAATPRGVAARGTIGTTDIHALVREGHAQVEGLRYEDFLPVSAAGIFASNLNQQGTRSTAAQRPVYSQAMFERILGRPVVDADVAYRGMQAASLLETYAQLGVLDQLPDARRGELESAVAAMRGAGAETVGAGS